MNSFIDAAINRTRTTMLLMLMVVLAGLIARSAIPIASEPHIEVPFFAVSISTKASPRRTPSAFSSCRWKSSSERSRA